MDEIITSLIKGYKIEHSLNSLLIICREIQLVCIKGISQCLKVPNLNHVETLSEIYKND